MLIGSVSDRNIEAEARLPGSFFDNKEPAGIFKRWILGFGFSLGFRYCEIKTEKVNVRVYFCLVQRRTHHRGIGLCLVAFFRFVKTAGDGSVRFFCDVIDGPCGFMRIDDRGGIFLKQLSANDKHHFLFRRLTWLLAVVMTTELTRASPFV